MGDFEVIFYKVLSLPPPLPPVRSVLHYLASGLQALQVPLLNQCVTFLTDSVCLAPYWYTAYVVLLIFTLLFFPYIM